MAEPRLIFNDRKYHALNLLLARCAVLDASLRRPFRYVTMGGTEMGDVWNVRWCTCNNVSSVLSYENERERFPAAIQRASELTALGCPTSVSFGDIYNFRRSNGDDQQYVFFLDFCGSFNGTHISSVRRWFQEDVLRPGDLVLVTSWLGRHPGWPRVLAPFEGEFLYLGIVTSDRRKALYYPFHPALVMYRALLESGQEGEVEISCLGFVKYSGKGGGPMGLYAFQLSAGVTDLGALTSNLGTCDTKTLAWDVLSMAE